MHLVFFVAEPVDDALAEAVLARVRALAGSRGWTAGEQPGWFDDPGAATPAERTTGGYVRTDDPDAPHAVALVDVACALSRAHGCTFEVQFREVPILHVAAGERRAPA